MCSHSPCPKKQKYLMSFMCRCMEINKLFGNQLILRGKGCFSTYITAASILAGVAVTLIDFYLTSFTTEAFLACTCVTALACVSAGCSIHTGLVVCAEVQILVTEQASPALLAVALPRLATGPMHTAWVANAFITGGTLPTRATYTLSRLFTVPMALTTAR